MSDYTVPELVDYWQTAANALQDETERSETPSDVLLATLAVLEALPMPSSVAQRSRLLTRKVTQAELHAFVVQHTPSLVGPVIMEQIRIRDMKAIEVMRRQNLVLAGMAAVMVGIFVTIAWVWP